ncbi:hypothetical protein B296_00016905 [Ensete ventricosum]|uniref:Uncharacterized protein n=1 Tax=Ensete ventricosum TaxID=4639 RepID=A0A426ZAF1_ENSVE|nr:hypothetical protein B296_00016905 [Ensete ventricosum]
MPLSDCHRKMRRGAVDDSKEGCIGGNGEALSMTIAARCKSLEKGGLDVLEPQGSRGVGVWGSLQWRLTTDAEEEGRNDVGKKEEWVAAVRSTLVAIEGSKHHLFRSFCCHHQLRRSVTLRATIAQLWWRRLSTSLLRQVK